jgi:peptide/nickel transport system substrate-binding protein
MRLTQDRAVQMEALATGESDIGTYIIGSELPDIQAMGNLQIMISNNGYQVLIFENIDPKTAHPAMTDINVRKAIVMAIDRELINESFYHGLYEIPATYWHGTEYDNPDLKPYPFDPDAARGLLDEAGWLDNDGDGLRQKDGRDLVLRYAYINGEQVTDAMVLAIQQMLAEVGIKMDIFTYTSDALWASYADQGPLALGQYDLTHWSDGLWYYPSPDTSYFLCSQIPTAENPNGYNWFGICLPVLDDLFATQAVELNHDRRVQIIRQIGKIMHDQVLIIPLHSDPDVWAVNNRLANVRFSGIDPLMFSHEWDVK